MLYCHPPSTRSHSRLSRYSPVPLCTHGREHLDRQRPAGHEEGTPSLLGSPTRLSLFQAHQQGVLQQDHRCTPVSPLHQSSLPIPIPTGAHLVSPHAAVRYTRGEVIPLIKNALFSCHGDKRIHMLTRICTHTHTQKIVEHVWDSERW